MIKDFKQGKEEDQEKIHGSDGMQSIGVKKEDASDRMKSNNCFWSWTFW